VSASAVIANENVAALQHGTNFAQHGPRNHNRRQLQLDAQFRSLANLVVGADNYGLKLPAISNLVDGLGETLEWPPPAWALRTDADSNQCRFHLHDSEKFRRCPAVTLRKMELYGVIAYCCA
jgi:hypothetical protein